MEEDEDEQAGKGLKGITLAGSFDMLAVGANDRRLVSARVCQFFFFLILFVLLFSFRQSSDLQYTRLPLSSLDKLDSLLDVLGKLRN